MCHRILWSLVLVFGMAALGQGEINLRGVVTSSGNPVEGVTVALLGQGISAQTNAAGEYSIVGTTPVISKTLASQYFSFRNGVLEITLPKSMPVRVKVTDVLGNLLKNEISSNPQAGIYRLNIAEISSASQLLLIRASLGNLEAQFRYFPLQNIFALSDAKTNFFQPVKGLARAAAVVDTLEVSKNGYTSKKVAIESFNAEVDITLSQGGPAGAFVENSGLDCEIGSPNGSNGGSNSKLPDPFTKWDGTQVTSLEDWRCRRRELEVEVGKLILGDKAPPPHTIGGTVTGTVTNSSYSVQVDNPDGSTSFSGTISLPNSGSAPYPAIVNVGGFGAPPSSILNGLGIATISYNNNEIATEASGDYRTGKYYDANPDYEGNTSALVAWAWGVSRIIDVLEQHPDVIDPAKIGVFGCSRLGKAAFVIGAYDQRIALGLPLEPGTGGPAPLRGIASYGGQSISSMLSESSWFSSQVRNFSNNSAAADMHDVAAMYAPRGLLMMDNPHIQHLSFQSNYLGVASAQKIWEAMGKTGAWYMGGTSNSSHCSDRPEYHEAIETMIRKFLLGEDLDSGEHTTTNAHSGVNVDSWTSDWDVTTFSN